ncbi:MAG: universal stress protein [Isosphaeraceae bacterium]
MRRVIAAVDNSAAAMPVVSTAAAAARLFRAELRAIHVEEAADPTAARAAAKAAGTRLLVVKGPTVAAAVIRVALQEDVVAVVLGVRSRPSGRRPAGHVAVKVATSVPKPIVVVPPDCVLPVHFRRVLIPLERDMVTASALRETIEALQGARAEIVLLHIFEERDLPLVTDQPQHETDAWISEFLRRYCPYVDERRVELRAGMPAEHLLTVAGEIGADALVLAWSQRLLPGRAVLVRTALEHSRVPVILVPVQRRSAGSPADDRIGQSHSQLGSRGRDRNPHRSRALPR